MAAPSENQVAPAKDTEALCRAAEALLREHPDARVCALSGNGLSVPIPPSVPLWGQEAVEGRSLFDRAVAADRHAAIHDWQAALANGYNEGHLRLLDDPGRWVHVHVFDVRERHNVLLAVLINGDDAPEADAAPEPTPPAAPRFCTLMEDEGGIVLDFDEAFTQMFGYTGEDVLGKSVLEQIHPDDQARAVEGWMTMLSTRRMQSARYRRKRKDGSFVWVDMTMHNFLNQPDRNHVLVEIVDVTAEMAAQQALHDQGELLRRLIEAMPDGLLQVDTTGNVLHHNARLFEILHGSAGADDGDEEPLLADVLRTLTTDGAAGFEAALASVFTEGVDRDVEVDVILPSGEWRRALMNIRALVRESGEVAGAITSVLDVTDSARARRELERRATYDALTGAHNRASILAAVERELQGESSAQTGVVFIDLDDFKAVNDTLGHGAGDELLIEVVDRLRRANRVGDEIGRLGGDEFLVLLRGVSGPQAAGTIARRMCEALQGLVTLSGGAVELRASAGVACGRAGMGTDELVRLADDAMYRSKAARLGRPVVGGESSPPVR